MNQRRAVLIGGPLDGHETAPRSLPFVWVGVAGGGVRVFDGPGQNRLLYRCTDAGWALIFAGYTHALCSGCELVYPRNAEGVCSACGGKLIPA